jgi:glycosyltransferase involved in cell wall biosynthesis
MQTVVATSYTPTLDSGRARRTYSLIRALAALGSVDLVYGAFGSPTVDQAFEEIDGLSLHRVERPGRIERLPAYLRARLAGVPRSFAAGIWPTLGRRAAEIAARAGTERLIADGPVAAAGLLGLEKTGADTVYSAHNLESSFRHRLADGAIPRAAMERFERLLLEGFDESWMVSPADLKGAAVLAPTARLRLVPNVVDVAAIQPVPPRSGERDLLFVGDFSYEPNRGGARFLVEEAMPALWREAPDLRLRIAGRGSDALPALDPRVEGLGFVDDLAALYAGAGCVAVPLLEGGGSPLKFVEALAYGVPIVATPRAAAGLEVEAGRQYLEAEPAGPAFAGAVLAALEPARGTELGREARELAEDRYSIESLKERIAG